MATFRDNKHVTYNTFHYFLPTTNPPQNSITELLHNRVQAIKYIKGMCFFSQSWLYSYFPEDLMIRFSEPVKIPDIKALLKIISGHKF